MTRRGVLITGKTDVHYTYWDVVRRLPTRTVVSRRTRVWKIGTICIWPAKDHLGKKFLIV